MNADLGFNYHEALKRQKFTQDDVDELRKKAKAIKIAPKAMTNKQLLMFLNSSTTTDDAVRKISVYYDIRSKSPQLFTNRDILSPEIQQSIQRQTYMNLPVTPDNNLLVFHSLSSSKASHFNYDPATKTFLMMIEACFYKFGPRDGIVLIYDMKNFRLGHLRRNSFKSMNKFFQFMQEGVPITLKSTHILNAVPFFHLIMTMIKPFMKIDVVNKIHLHSSMQNYDKFHADCIPKSCLPSDFGGDLESVAELHRKHCLELFELRKYFLAEQMHAELKLEPLNN